MTTSAVQPADVKEAFAAFQDEVRPKLERLRELILDVASVTDGVGEIEETLKWGQPSFLTHNPKSGTTIRIGDVPSRPGRYGMFVHCQTSLVDSYRELYSGILQFDGKRAIELAVDQDPPEDVLRHCIELALTYHTARRGRRSPS